MKHFAVLALLCIAQALAGPAARDLAEDINTAETALTRWDVEITSLEGRLNLFSDEISISISGVYSDIKTWLTEVEGLDAGTIDSLNTVIDGNVVSASDNVTAAIDALHLVRDDLIITNAALRDDLPSLAGATDTLRADYDAGNAEIAAMSTNVQASFADTDAALRNALDGLDGTPVIQILVSLQKVTDIVDNERFELTNAQIIYDFRADAAFTALQVVIDQV